MSKVTNWFIGGAVIVAIGGIGYASFGNHGRKTDDKIVKVGIMSGSKQDTQIWQSVAKTAKKQYGITLKFKEFSDYNQPNKALAEGDIDINAFQHYAFLDASNQATGNKIVAIGDTVISQSVCIVKRIRTSLISKLVIPLPCQMMPLTKAVHSMF